MEYRFVKNVTDCSLNMSIPGLAKYEVTNLNQHKSTITMKGTSDHLVDFTLSNVEVNTDMNIIY